jgi:outer membrane protein TolC
MKKHISLITCNIRYIRFSGPLMICLILFISEKGFPQKILTLKECYEGAYATSPIANEKKSYTDIWQLKDKNISRGWLPTLDASGSFVYNSSVVDMTDILGNLPLPGIAELIHPLPHEQYKVTVEINQMIYDGGAVKSAKLLEKTDLEINAKQTETDLYKLRGQVNTAYFNLMLLDRHKELLMNYLEIVNKRISSMNTALNNGVMMKSDVDVLMSEKIKLEQQIAENHIRKTSLLKILTFLTGIPADESTQLIIPSTGQKPTDKLTRSELEIFDLRKEQLNATLRVIESRKMPKAFGFATLGYGNPPGSNFFKDKFAPYYILGAGIKWNIFDWEKAKSEKMVISLQQGIIENRKNDLTESLKRLLEAKNSEISSLESLLKTDTELIEIRKRITAAAGSQFENGTITATDYLNELNSEKQVLINYEIHKINLALANVEYLNICGKEIE